MPDLNDEAQKKAFEEALSNAIDKWLDKQFAKFGKWSFFGAVSLGLATLTLWYLKAKGYNP